MAEFPDNPQGAGGAVRLRSVIAMALPVVITTGSRAAMDVADYAMISHAGQNEVQAAMLPAQMIMWSFLVFGLGIVSMVNTFAAQSLGAGRKTEAGVYGWQGLYIALAAGALTWLLRGQVGGLLSLIGHEPAVQAQELIYSRIALLTAFPTIGAGALGWFFIGIHRPWITTFSAIEANLVNVAVSYVLIFGVFGVEPMGIAGAAWGTMVAVVYRVVRLFAVFMARPMAVEFDTRDGWRPSRPKLGKLLRVGVPAGIQWVSEVSVWAIFATVIIGRRFGTVDLVATNICWQYMRVAFMPCMGVGQALAAMVGRSLGEGDPDKAMAQTRLASRLTIGYMGALSAIYLLGRTELIGWFNADPEVLRIGERIMVCAVIFQLFDGIGIVHDGALRGAGDTFVPAAYYMASTWFALVGLAWLITWLYPGLRAVGPWIAATLLIANTSLFVTWRWHRRGWRRIDLLGSPAEPGEQGAVLS